MRATDHPLNNISDTRQPGVTQAQDEQNEMDIGTTQNNRTGSPVRTAETVNPADEITAHEDTDTKPDLTPIESVENDEDLEQTRTGERERKSTPTLNPLLEMRLTKTLCQGWRSTSVEEMRDLITARPPTFLRTHLYLGVD